MQNSNTETPNSENKKPKMSKNNRILLTVVCIFLSVVLLFGVGFGVYFAIDEANTVVRLENVKMDEGVVRVFASYYKDLHISSLRKAGYYNARDTEEFWGSLHESGKTQGELYLSSLESYISGMAAGANIYLSSFKLTDDDRLYIESKTGAFISSYGSEEAFNEKAEKFGFDYDDFCRAMEISYTAELALYSIYGAEGESLKSSAFESRCEDYLKKYYSRVKVIYIAKEKIFDTELNDWRDLYPSEEEKRNEQIELFKAAVADGSMVEGSFDAYLSSESSLHDGDAEMGRAGYYFAKGTQQTERFKEIYYPEIVDAALEMSVGEVRAVDCEWGVAFLCRCDVVSGAYTDEENPFFSDFYKIAATEFYAEDVGLLSTEAVFKDSYYELNPITIPANRELFVTGWN